jgi:hypothetical protein
MNETYLFDIQQKTKSQSRQAMKDGVYVGGRPSYGYMRSPEDHRKLILDEPAAEIVRQIFEWAKNSASSSEIARRLNEAMIPSPKKHSGSTGPGVWYTSTVNRILFNEIYLGHLVQGKTTTIDNARQVASSEDWIYAYDVHKAIISPEVFNAVKKRKQDAQEKVKGRTAETYSLNIFRGKIYCAHCGGRLERKKNHDKYFFQCVANRNAPDSCSGNRISEDAVRRELSEQLLHLKDTLSSELPAISQEPDAIPELNFIAIELARLQNISRSLYENLVSGVIECDDYLELKSVYQNKTSEMEQREAELRQQVIDAKEVRAKTQQAIETLGAFPITIALDKSIIDQFLDRLEIFREGRVHVVWKDQNIG